jgi:hypothetical protein
VTDGALHGLFLACRQIDRQGGRRHAQRQAKKRGSERSG